MRDNPWKLTKRQSEVMDAIISSGCYKRAAVQLGVSHYTVSSHLRLIAGHMDMQTHLLRVLAWDRWRRGQA